MLKAEPLDQRCIYCKVDKQACKRSAHSLPVEPIIRVHRPASSKPSPLPKIVVKPVVKGPTASTALKPSTAPKASPIASPMPVTSRFSPLSAPALSGSTSLPLSLEAGAPMDQDSDRRSSSSHKRSLEHSAPGPSSKFPRMATSFSQARRDSEVSATVPGPSARPLPGRGVNPFSLHLDSLELLIRKGDSESALQRVEELRIISARVFKPT